ncbi:KITH [Enterospora canceri]|uniref:Thymidine kinase n=1 Tax=Enterospora canceri TaxID=1081671 RepID=A0A1Y1S7T5_9MICR|nr:KITH [Enterospora canceri]
MAELKFVFGPVSTGKTVELLLQAHQITKIHGKTAVKLMKPAFDTRDGEAMISSASGMQARADFVIGAGDNLQELEMEPGTYLLVDEVQFFTLEQIMQLRRISLEQNIHVECYGLLKDFRNDLFFSAAKLVELADEIVQMKTFCYLCSRKRLANKMRNAQISMKIIKNGDVTEPTLEGESKQVGGIDLYVPVCSRCYYTAFKEVEMTAFVLSQSMPN